MKKAFLAIALAGTSVLLFYQIVALSDFTWESFFQVVVQADPILATLGFVLLAVVFLCSAIKWKMVTEAQNKSRLGTYFYFRYITMAVAIGQMLPLTLSNAAVRALALKRKKGHTLLSTTGLFIWDQGFDFLALSLLAAIGLLQYFLSLPLWQSAMIALASGCIILWGMQYLIKIIELIVTLLGNKKWLPEGLRNKLTQLTDTQLLETSLARRLFALGFLKYTTSAAVFSCFFSAYGLGSMAKNIFWGAPTAEMAGVLSQMPGGLGALDWTWIGVLKGNGLEAQAAAEMVIGMRFILLISYAALLLLVWGTHLLRRRPTKAA